MKNKIILILLLVSVGWGQTTIQYPDWEYRQDFNYPFYPDSVIKHTTSVNTSYDPLEESIEEGHDSKVAVFVYHAGAESQSEMRIKLPNKTVRVSVEYYQYVPSNYVHGILNGHKCWLFWAGRYADPALLIASEGFNAVGGARPSINLDIDHVSRGHDFLTDQTVHVWKDNQGSWQKNYIYIELAKDANDTGVVEVYKNDTFMIGSRHTGMIVPHDAYLVHADTNWLDTFYIMGYASGGFSVETRFQIDDLVIKADTSFANDPYAKRRSWVDVYLPDTTNDTIHYICKNKMTVANLQCVMYNTAGNIVKDTVISAGDSTDLSSTSPASVKLFSRRNE